MSNRLKEMNIKNHACYFLMINIKNLDTNKVKINEKSNRNILIYHIGYATVKNLSYITINSVNLL